MTIEELQQQITDLKRQVDGLLSLDQSQYRNFVPSGVNFKLISPQSLNPGHLHDADGLSLNVASIPQVVKLASTMVKTSDTTMATIPGMQWNVLAGKTYTLKTKLILKASNATGGIQIGLNGTMTTTSLEYSVSIIGDDNLIKVMAWATSLGVTHSTAGQVFYLAEINAGFTVNAAGTFNIQFAQAVASGNSSVDVNSFAELIQIK